VTDADGRERRNPGTVAASCLVAPPG
jgi:hypothetical protein